MKKKSSHNPWALQFFLSFWISLSNQCWSQTLKCHFYFLWKDITASLKMQIIVLICCRYYLRFSIEDFQEKYLMFPTFLHSFIPSVLASFLPSSSLISFLPTLPPSFRLPLFLPHFFLPPFLPFFVTSVIPSFFLSFLLSFFLLPSFFLPPFLPFFVTSFLPSVLPFFLTSFFSFSLSF